jgi:hypothetical protein
VNRVAHLPELRFALGEPEIDTTTIDNTAFALEAKAYYIRRAGSDGFRIHHRATLKKVVSDRKASLDFENEVKPAMRNVVEKQFDQGASVPIVPFPADAGAVADSPRLTLVLMDPQQEWTGAADLRSQVGEWTRQRGTSPRLYPASLVWCFRKPGRDLRDKVETWLAWKRVADEVGRGDLGGDYERAELADVRGTLATAEEEAKDEVWAAYRFVVVTANRTTAEDQEDADGLKVIDLGAGHASGRETLCGRVIAALKASGLLSESVGAGYIDRNWPPALKASGAWPLKSLRQSFLNGSLTRLLDPDATLRAKLPEFVEQGEFGLASGQNPDGTYERLSFGEVIDPAEVTFDADVFLLKAATAKALKAKRSKPVDKPETDETTNGTGTDDGKTKVDGPGPGPGPTPATCRLIVTGNVPGEVWNRLGTKLLPKLRSGDDLEIQVKFGVTVKAEVVASLEAELRQALQDLGLKDKVSIHRA